MSWQEEPGFWAVLGYPEALEVLSQPEIFSSAYGTGIFSDTAPGLTSLNLSDPPIHTGLRAPVEHWLQQVKPQYRRGQDLPRQTLRAILRVDESTAVHLQHQAGSFARGGAEGPLLDALRGLECPLKNLAPQDQLYLLRLLTLASLESTSTALASLAQHRPEKTMIEEMLRLHPPIQRFGRRIQKDYRLGGQSLAEGQRVLVFFAAANRDPRVFADPDLWRPKRPAHLTFGAGPHRCPGAALARRQLRFMQPEPGPPPRRFYASSFMVAPW